jgi:hypothetical protein
MLQHQQTRRPNEQIGKATETAPDEGSTLVELVSLITTGQQIMAGLRGL